ncbi:MAG: UPF0147 family protein [Candidatus Diapherotrites archaeon]
MGAKAKSKVDSKDFESVAELMENVLEDTGVPRNIRNAVDEAREKVLNKAEEEGVRVSSAIYVLEDISNDINMPFHTRTEIWTIISRLESIREKTK